MKNKNNFAGILAFILIFAVALVPVLAQTVASAETAVNYADYDLSASGSSSTVELDVEHFVKLLGGSHPFGDLELDYIEDGYSYINVRYETPTAEHFELTAIDDVVTVTAEPYVYVTAKGATVTWYPVSARVDGSYASVGFTAKGGAYVATLSDVDIDKNTAVSVEYRIDYQFVIDKDDINSALNATYSEAVRIKAEYLAAKAEYDERMAEYQDYLDRQANIDEAMAEYNKYLDDLALYKEKLQKYNAYLEKYEAYMVKYAAYEEYLAKLAAYNEYNDYKKNYTKLLNEYNANVVKYQEYLANIAALQAQLDVFDTGLFDTVTTVNTAEVLERQLYSCIIGDTVDSVLRRREEIVAGIPSAEAAIDDAGRATDVLRAILGDYTKLDDEKEKYEFYIANYDAIKSNIILLTQTLYDLYRYDIVKTGVHTGVEGSGGKTDKYVIMVSQLILFANAISDEPVYSYSGSKYEKILLNKNTEIVYLTGDLLPYKKVTKTAIQILENNEYVKDTNSATPLSTGYPQYMDEPVQPVHPNELPVVTRPSYVSKPTAPTPVEEPVPPEEVTDPRLEHMDEPLKPAILDDKQASDLILALDNGEIVKRADVTEDYEFTPSVSLGKNVVNDENVTITFYGNDRVTVLSRVIAALYSSVNYSGATPTKASTPTEDYTFSGWVDADGNSVDLGVVRTDLSLYPAYRVTSYAQINFYDTDGVTLLYNVRARKGSAVSYSGTIPTKSDDNAVYTFEKWVDKSGNVYDLSAVGDSVDLYPFFKSTPYVYVNFYDTDRTTVLYTVKLLPGQSASYVGNLPVKASIPEADYVFSSWVDANGNAVSLSAISGSLDVYPSFKTIPYAIVNFYSENGATLLESMRVRVGASVSYSGAAPVKPSVPEADYVFAYWRDASGNRYNLSSVSGSVDLYPNFDVIPYVVVNFYDTDMKTLLDTVRARHGSQITYNGRVPVKESVPEADYVFSGWADKDGRSYSLYDINASVDLYPEFRTVSYVVIRFYDTDGAKVLLEKRVRPGTAIAYEGVTPVKESVPEADYVFSGWVNKSGGAFDLLNPQLSADLYPDFTVIPYVVVNFYDTDRQTVLYTSRVRPGSAVSYKGATPVKASIPEADYVFSSWVDVNGDAFDLKSVNTFADLYPTFDSIPYVVLRFLDVTGSLITEKRVLKGSECTYDARIPTKESIPVADYVFSHWVDSDGAEYNLAAAEHSTSLTPVFDTVDYVVINFYDENGVLLESQRVLSGTEVIYGGEIPEKPSEPEAGYLFAGWRDADGKPFSLSAPTVCADPYPIYTVTSYIILDFHDVDGTLIISERILKGKAYSYSERLPEIASTELADYIFVGWRDADGRTYDLGTTEYSASLYPVFETVDYIILNFRDEDGTLLESMRVRPGVQVIYGGEIPEKPSEPEAGYLFTGWRDADGNSFSLSAPTVSADLYPVFAVTSYIVLEFYDLDGSLIATERILKGKAYSYAYEVPTKESVTDADFEFSHWVDEQGVAYDLNTTLYSAKLYPAFDSIKCVTIRFYDTDGVTLIETHRVRAGQSVAFAGEAPVKASIPEADYVFCGWQNSRGDSYDLSSVNETADLYPEFDVIPYVVLSFYDTDRVTLLETKRVRPGSSIVFNGREPVKASIPEADYVFSGWIDKDGSAYDLTNVGYTTDLYPEFDVIRYVVIRFHDTDGETVIYEQRTLPYGVVTFVGQNPVKPSAPLEDYFFSGWHDDDGNAYGAVISSDVSLDLYPAFNTVKYANVSFYDTDGVTLLCTYKVRVGSAVAYEGENPVKASEPEADYYFSYWVDGEGEKYDLDSVGESVDLYPYFNTVTYVVVEFYDTDGVTLLETHRVRKGEPVIFTAEKPSKTSTPESDYVFVGWIDADGNAYDVMNTNASARLYPDFDVVRYAIITFYGTDNTTVIETHRVLLGTEVDFEGGIPVKPEDYVGVYTFCRWVNSQGVEINLGSVTESADLYPEFTVTPYLDVVFYGNDRVSVLYSVRVLLGSSASYVGDEPTKDTDEQGRYTFIYWADASGAEFDLGSVAESVDLYPAYRLTPYISVTFMGADGVTVLDVQKVFPGESVIYGGTTPLKESIPEADYTFAGVWLDASGEELDLSSLSKSATVYPKFTVTAYIVVNFYAFDGVTVLESLRQRPDQKIAYTKDTPVRDATPLAVYEFKGWTYADGTEYNFERLSTSADFYPSFREIPYVTVTFYAPDGVGVLYSVTVLQGEEVAYRPDVPVKEADSCFAYEFSRWILEDGSEYTFASDATVSVYPEFRAIPFVTVTFIGPDGVTVLDTQVVLQGAEAVFAGVIPTKESDIVFDYVFDAWVDGDGVVYDVSCVQGDAVLYPTYRGIYKEYELDTNVGGIGLVKFTVDLGDVELVDIPLEHFLDVAAENRASLCIRTADATVEFAYSQISAMRQAAVATVTVNFRAVSNGYNCFYVLRNAHGMALNLSVSATLSVDCQDAERAEMYDVGYSDPSGNGISVAKRVVGSAVIFDAYSNTGYTLRIKHDVNVSADMPLSIGISAERVEKGETVTVTILDTVPDGVTVIIYYYDADSVKHIIEGDSFVMPDGYVLIGMEIVDIFYTVTFISDGRILSQNQYKYGEDVVVPRDPVKQNDGTYFYTFMGWSSEITSVTGDAVYEARFDAELIPEDEDDGITLFEKYSDLIIKAAVVVAVVVAILVFVIVLLFRKGYMSLNWKI